MRLTTRVLAGLACALVAAAPAAAAPWSAPATLPGGDVLTAPRALAFSPAGRGLVTALAPGQTLGTPIVADRPLAASTFTKPAGPVLWAFTGRDQIVAATDVYRRGRASLNVGLATPGGRLRDVRTLARTRGTLSFDLDANARGSAAIAFTRDGHLYLAVRASGRGRFGRPIRVSGRAHVLAFPAVRVNSRGDVLAAWTASLRGRPHRSPPHATMARVLRADGQLSRLWRLGASAGFPPELSVAFTRGRRALVAWQSSIGSARVARVAYASRGGRFHAAQTLERVTRVAGELEMPARIRVAFGSNGRGVAVWTGCCTPNRAIHAAVLAGARFGPAQTLSQPGRDANVDSLAAGPRGELVTTWTEGAVDAPSVVAAVLPAEASRWRAAELVSDHAADSQLAIDPVTRVAFAVFRTAPASGNLRYATRLPVDAGRS